MQLKLTHHEIDIFSDLSSQIDVSPSEDPEIFLEQSDNQKKHIPEHIISELLMFASSGSPSGFLLISQFPIMDSAIPKTPPSNEHFIGEHTQMARIQAMINQTIGEMIAYEAEGYGKLFQDMVPKYEYANTQTSLSSKVELELHTEQAFSLYRPDILSLACLRSDPTALTYILHVSDLIAHLSPDKQSLLWKPLWMIGVDMSFTMNNNMVDGNMRGPLSILSGTIDDPQLTFDQDLMVGITEEAENLRKEIIEIYIKYRKSHVLLAGEIMLVDNRRAVHGRSPFVPRFDGTDRFIVRSFVVLDYARTRDARPSGGRVVESRYS